MYDWVLLNYVSCHCVGTRAIHVHHTLDSTASSCKPTRCAKRDEIPVHNNYVSFLSGVRLARSAGEIEIENGMARGRDRRQGESHIIFLKVQRIHSFMNVRNFLMLEIHPYQLLKGGPFLSVSKG